MKKRDQKTRTDRGEEARRTNSRRATTDGRTTAPPPAGPDRQEPAEGPRQADRAPCGGAPPARVRRPRQRGLPGRDGRAGPDRDPDRGRRPLGEPAPRLTDRVTASSPADHVRI